MGCRRDFHIRREPREKYPRWTHLFAPANEVEETPHIEHSSAPVVAPIADVLHAVHIAPGEAERAAKVDEELAALRAELARLKQEMAGMQAQIASLQVRAIQ